MARQNPVPTYQGHGQTIPDRLKPHLAHRFQTQDQAPSQAPVTQPSSVPVESQFKSPTLPKPLESSLHISELNLAQDGPRTKSEETKPANVPLESLFRSPVLPKPLEPSLDGSEVDLAHDSQRVHPEEAKLAKVALESLFKSPILPKPLEPSLHGSELSLSQDKTRAKSDENKAADVPVETLFKSPILPKPSEPSLHGSELSLSQDKKPEENKAADVPLESLFKSLILPKPIEPSLDGSELNLCKPGTQQTKSNEVQAFLQQNGIPGDAGTVPVTVLVKLLAQVSQQRGSPTANDHVQPSTPKQGGKTEQCSLNLKQYRVPRRNDNFEGSTPGSVGSLSTFVSSDTGVGHVNEGSDVRKSIAPESLLKPAAHGWTKSTWADEEATQDQMLQADSYRNTFIRAWAKDAASGHLVVKYEQLQQWLCDIDTMTGQLVPPVQYGETIADLGKCKNKEHAWRQLNWTSNLLAHKKFEHRGLINNTNGTEGGLMGTGANAQPAQLSAWEQPAEPVSMPVITVPETIHHPDEPKVACYLRPATKKDLDGVLTIYNHEVAHGLQALDTRPMAVQDVVNLWTKTRTMKLPFLVMVKGKYGGKSHSPPAKEEILGFAFVSVVQTGLAGSEQKSTAHMSGRAHVYVHHDYRQKKIGFSLLDKLLSVVSSKYATKLGCDFDDAANDTVYDSITMYNKPRLFFKIYIQYMVRTTYPVQTGLEDKEDFEKDLPWVRRMLHDLRFDEKMRFEGMHRVPCRGNQQAIFLDALVFEHTCDDLIHMPTFPAKNTLI